ncbi:hypothetical protein ES703_117035 [subsurface metagenome]
MEDILTSNIFSFFKYSTREIFLKGYLNKLGFNISNQEANEAEFIFWPRFEENTEPDLVLIVGDYYLLIEAKYFSGFAEESKKTKAQLLREIEGGKIEARNYGKDFRLIAITADHYYKENKFKIIPPDFIPHFKWTNWQSVSSFLYNILESSRDIKKQERDFALDLYNLLDKKNLRDFQGLNSLYNISAFLKSCVFVFFEARTAKFRGDFIGFMHSLSFDKKIKPLRKTVFLSSQKKIFTPLLQLGKLKYVETPIFYKECTNHG